VGKSLRRLLSLIVGIALLTFPHQAQAARNQCPTELESLVAWMLRDLPGYANRAIVRSRGKTPITALSSVLTAGRPEFEPLPLAPSSAGARQRDPTLRQVFLTTLERESIGGKFSELQQFHWLFLARAETGWQLVLLFTRTGSYPSGQPPTPPRESSQGVIGQAIRAWLRDCNAGFVRF
jgi:hypothetical protein